MFTGIIETTTTIVDILLQDNNKLFVVKNNWGNAIKIDQSIAHNGVCLTVMQLHQDTYSVVAIHETLQKTNLNALHINDTVNIERCMQLGDRLDGHIVQGHVDGTATCKNIEQQHGSWLFTFELDNNLNPKLIVEKGSIAVNGVSLTAFNLVDNFFSVAIIPYTYQHTNFNLLQVGNVVNIEFDIIGKYILRQHEKN